MDITERINNISPYFSSMQITNLEDGQKIIYVVVNFPREWVIDEETAYKNAVTVSQGNNVGEYWFCTSIETGPDVIFDTIESNITKMKEAIERGKLLGEKTKELKSMFEDESISLEKLRGIKFVLGGEPASEIVITKQSKKEEK